MYGTSSVTSKEKLIYKFQADIYIVIAKMYNFLTNIMLGKWTYVAPITY